MFSGLTNQVSSWIGAAKGEPQDEEVPTPPNSAATATTTTTTAAPPQAGADTAAAPLGDEGDKSATGGADSRPATGPGTPTDENAGQIGQVTHKVTAGAKSIGSFLYSSFNKAGDKIKHLKDNTLLGEFNKEQEAFIKNQQGGSGPGACPWTGHANEAKIKEEILSLSADRRNFVRAPPAGVEFEFDYDVSYPIALAIMNEDKELEKMRFELVPKIITEENFWRNYFYRVSLICQAGDLGTLGDKNEFVRRGVSEDTEA